MKAFGCGSRLALRLAGTTGNFTRPQHDAHTEPAPPLIAYLPAATTPGRSDEGCLVIDDLWYKNGVIYCLSVGTYMDANGDGVGDFKGLLRRPDYLHGLGITAIWLMPFHPPPAKADVCYLRDYIPVYPPSRTL